VSRTDDVDAHGRDVERVVNRAGDDERSRDPGESRDDLAMAFGDPTHLRLIGSAGGRR
jgi:hypothetical protein